MSKRYDEAIEVTPDPHTEVPLSFYWRGRLYEIDQRLSSWSEGGGWKERDFHRVLARPSGVFATGELDADGFMRTTPGAVYDLAFDPLKKVWKLARLWD